MSVQASAARRAGSAPGARCVDAAGVERDLASWARPEWDAATQDSLERVLNAASGGAAGSAGGGAGVMMLVTGGLVVVAAVLVGALPKRVGWIVAACALGLGSMAALWWVTRGGGGGARWNARVRDAWISERRCPSCVYPLTVELTGEHRGKWRCSECGGVWEGGRGASV